MNSNFIANTTKEFGLSVIIHEIEHSFFRLVPDEFSHPTFIGKYFEELKTAILQSTEMTGPNAEKNAVSLLLNGVGDLYYNSNYQNYSTNKSNFEAIMQRHNLTIPEMTQIILNLKNPANGTPCN